MTLDELKQHKDGVCLGYTSIGHLMKNVYPANLGLPKVEIYKDYVDSKLYPIIMYYKNTDGKEGILCRPMLYKDNLLKSVGLLYSSNKKLKPICYVAKTVLLPIDTDIDSIYEVKE